MRRIVVTIVGGGVSAPRLCEVLAHTLDDLPHVELRLTARRADRLRILTRHTQARLARCRRGWTVEGTNSLEAAATDADVVILLVRVGGLGARAWDEEFPRQFNLQGDEGLGPGGVANAWRTVPQLDRIALTLHKVAPKARVLNLMSPLGITTRLLLDRGLETYGLCELPETTLEGWLTRAGVSRSTSTWQYGGLNHLGWFWNFQSAGRDLLSWLADNYQPGDPNPVDRGTLDDYRGAPLRYFYHIFKPEIAQRLGLVRSTNRAAQLMTLSEELISQFAREPGSELPREVRLTPWLDRAVAPATAALLGGPPHRGFVNVGNGGLIAELAPELVVELPATFSENGVTATRPDPLPESVARFLDKVGTAELLTYSAATTREPELLEHALRALPLPMVESDIQELATLVQLGPTAEEDK